MILFLILSFSTLISSEECDLTKCNGTYRLVPVEGPKVIVNSTKMKITILRYPEKVELLSYKRRYWWAYCYDGGGVDSNSGCWAGYYFMQPTPAEARRWYDEKKCPTGMECEPYKCYGSNSWHCTEKYVEKIENDVGPETIKWGGAHYLSGWEHTCVLSWGCKVHKESVPIRLIHEDGKTIAYVTNIFGDKITYDEKGYLENQVDADGFHHVLYEKAKTPDRLVLESDCYVGGENDIVCIPDLKEWGLGKIAFQITAEKIGISGFLVMSLLKDYVYPSNNKLMRTGEEVTLIFPPLNPHKAASISDLWNLDTEQKAIQMRNSYNYVQLALKLVEVEETIRLIVTEVSKINPGLLKRIFKSKSTYKWLTKDLFTQCPCVDIEAESSNCISGFIYKNGIYTKTNDSKDCFALDTNLVTNVTLYEPLKIDLDLLSSMPIEGADSDSDAWSWLVKMQHSSRESYSLSTDPSAGGFIQDIISKIKDPFAEIKSWFTVISSFVAWIALLVAFCKK